MLHRGELDESDSGTPAYQVAVKTLKDQEPAAKQDLLDEANLLLAFIIMMLL